MGSIPFIEFHTRQSLLEFLDLPWKHPIIEWTENDAKILEVERGISRHDVIFIDVNGKPYGIKELPNNLAKQEYLVLRKLEQNGLPTVIPVGFIHLDDHNDQKKSVLITEYLEHSIPYRSLFKHQGFFRYQNHLLNAIAGFLVQLHLAGFYWGDCSLSNILFKRDAGEFQAFFVDAETSEHHPSVSDGMRNHDLDIMEENITGGLLDLSNITSFPDDFDVYEIGRVVKNRYLELWNLITDEIFIPEGQNYLIQEHINKLNDLGFSIDEIELNYTRDGHQLKMRTIVTDKNYHSHQLLNLTGVTASEIQSRLLLNEIREVRATLSHKPNKSIPLSQAAFHWLHRKYTPTIKKIESAYSLREDPPELYCQILEHKWLLSEKKGKDVGLKFALNNYIKQFLR